MEVYNPYSVVQLSEVLEQITIRRNSGVIYQGRGVVSNLVNTGLMLIVSVTPVDDWHDLSHILDSGEKLHRETCAFIDEWEEAHRLHPGYQLAVIEIRSFLLSFHQWLHQVDLDYPPSSSADDELPRESFEGIAAPFVERMNRLSQRFEEEAEQIPEELVSIHKSFTQRDLHPLLLTAPFVHRVYAKPLGYPGDYEMINMIYRDRLMGRDTYSKMVNTLYIRAPIPQSVRHRNDTLVEYLVDETHRVMQRGRRLSAFSVGCGSAHEVSRFIRNHSIATAADFRLMDFNQETIDSAREQIGQAVAESGRSPGLEFVHQSVHTLLKNASNKRKDNDDLDTFDFVYCAGLFDYLSDKVCGKLLELFYRHTKPGGLVFVTNMHTNNPNRFMMEHTMEWYLIYRNESQMESLAPKVGIQRTYTDRTGINLCLEIRKPEEQ
ncbi:class I SAM-dependent methyltransferase [Endothiovibrio diazotrophicus]